MKPLPIPYPPRPLPQIALPSAVLTAMREAIEVRDYASMEAIAAEALWLWHQRRQHELLALASLNREIAAALAGKKPDAKTIAELRARGRALLGVRENLRR